MPWDSFRKKRSSASSPLSKKKDQTRKQIQQPVDQNQLGSDTSSVRPHASTSNNKDARNHCPTSGMDSRGNGVLPHEVYQKIKEVDQEPSTLTAAGVEGLSARVQEKYEFTQLTTDGIARTYVCQTVEIIKRPGQSLGLYLREGNGIDRADGVFVSRLADGFDLHKSGVLSSGDEILTVNDVTVTKTSIDEVVVMISIPRRLVLRTRTPKGFAANALKDLADSMGSSTDASTTPTKPIAVLKQLPREESRESSLTDDGTPLISSQLIATAQTPLGVKARQQETATAYGGHTCKPHLPAGRSLAPSMHPVQAPSTSVHQPVPPPRQFEGSSPQPSSSDRWSYNRQLALHAPKVLDAHGRPLNDADGAATSAQIGRKPNVGNNTAKCQPESLINVGGVNDSSSSFNPSGCRTADSSVHFHAQRLQNHLQALERATASHSISTSSPFTVFCPRSAGPPNWRPVVPEPSTAPHRSLSGYGMSHVLRPVLRQSSCALREPANSAVVATQCSNVKSNSLPRRQPGRAVKWRSELPVAVGQANGKAPSYCYSSDVSDSDGAVSAPEFPMSPTFRGVPQPVYPLPRQPSGCKTVDDIFSRAEYQEWTRTAGPSDSRTVSDSEGQNQRYGNDYVDTVSGHHRWAKDWRHATTRETADSASHHKLTPGGQARGISHIALVPFEVGWNHNRSAMDDGESSSSCSSRPSQPPRSSRILKSRSSSLPPKGVLHRSLSKPLNGPITGDQAHEPVTNGGTSLTRAGGYALDVSPLPHRRLPLSLAAAYPGFGYTCGAGPDGVGGYYSTIDSTAIAALTGLLTVRIIEGRCLDSRGGEELYCVLEVDGEHRARTEVSDWHCSFKWQETFVIDVWDCRQTDFYVYSWHPQYRHKLKYHASVHLIDALLNMTKFDLNDDSSPSPPPKQSSNHSLALNLNPCGQLFIQLGFRPMPSIYRRTLATRRSAYFGMALQTLIDREARSGGNAPVPVVMARLVEEIERRGVDASGLYLLCGSLEKKQAMKEALECDPFLADLSADSVPDVNILTTVLKDFLRELPEPLVPHSTFQMLLEAWKTCVSSEKECNARLMLGVIDCLPKTNKCTLMVLMDHSKRVIVQSPYNGLSAMKFSVIFGPLVFCTSQAYPMSCNGSAFENLKPYASFLDHRLASRLLEVLLEYWPSLKGKPETGEYSTLTVSKNGVRSLVELLHESAPPESNC